MAPKTGFERLIFASHNDGKIKEINGLLDPYGIEAISAKKMGLNDPEETGKTFFENAAIKARAAKSEKFASLADDSGLEVMALNGDPGIYSARWAGEPRNFDHAMEKVQNALLEAGTDDYRARFVTVLCLIRPGGSEEYFEGEIRGRLNFPPRGDKGFGYDPIFIPDGYKETFGEMDPAIKQEISHRADAFRKLIKGVFEV